MKTAAEIRRYLADNLVAILDRPGMYGVNHTFEMMVRARLWDLAVVDERTKEFEAILAELRSTHQLISTGVVGALEHYHFGDGHDLTDEVASIYARVASLLGYRRPPRRLTRREWTALRRRARRWLNGPAIGPATLLEEAGTPSYAAKGQAPRVFAYASEDDADGWIAFDFWHRSTNAPLTLRDIRLPAKDFRRGLALVSVKAKGVPRLGRGRVVARLMTPVSRRHQTQPGLKVFLDD